MVFFASVEGTFIGYDLLQLYIYKMVFPIRYSGVFYCYIKAKHDNVVREFTDLTNKTFEPTVGGIWVQKKIIRSTKIQNGYHYTGRSISTGIPLMVSVIQLIVDVETSKFVSGPCSI